MRTASGFLSKEIDAGYHQQGFCSSRGCIFVPLFLHEIFSVLSWWSRKKASFADRYLGLSSNSASSQAVILASHWGPPGVTSLQGARWILHCPCRAVLGRRGTPPHPFMHCLLLCHHIQAVFYIARFNPGVTSFWGLLESSAWSLGPQLASASPVNLLELRVLTFHPRPAESRSSAMGCEQRHGWFWRRLEFASHRPEMCI